METPIDRSISETDLHAYIDGGLEEDVADRKLQPVAAIHTTHDREVRSIG